MKIIYPSLIPLLLTLNSCSNTDIQNKESIVKSEINIVEDKNEESQVAVELLPNQRFGRSQILNSKFEPELIFGVWTTSYDATACDFEINEKRLIFCDYDGDGERLYKIIEDSIFIDNSYLIFKGKILNASKDTLIIHWQENENAEVLLRWKN